MVMMVMSFAVVLPFVQAVYHIICVCVHDMHSLLLVLVMSLMVARVVMPAVAAVD